MRRFFSSTASTMGKFRKRNGKSQGHNNRLGKRDNRPVGNDGYWVEIKRENAKWETYYKDQQSHLIPDEEEWQLFKKTCQENLPLTFRVTGSKQHANEIADLFKTKHMPFLDKLVDAEGNEIASEDDAVLKYQPPKAFSWYPNQLAFQIDLPKSMMKKNPQFSKTQRFLVSETEVGNISRQEAVSMIPPLLLDVEPEHYVLDMCAAPGSKTAQLVESLHSKETELEKPTGFVMANDSDYKRSHMLVHQIKRLNSPNFLVVNHDAQFFPKMKLEESDSEYVKFDRVLCDVPCTGDATMRKNINVWKDWGTGNAIGLHTLQLNILMRGLQLLKNGGRLVYSTCSLNPIENEAVVAAALKRMGGKVKTVNCDDRLPGLVRRQGVSTWKVIGKDMQERTEPSESELGESYFPPTEEESKELHLENCIRVYPHFQNTGGFFITVLEKIDSNPAATANSSNHQVPVDSKKRPAEDEQDEESKKLKLDAPTEEGSEEPQQKKKKERLPRDANEEPFNFLEPNNAALQQCWDFYDVADTFSKDCTLVRNATGEPLRTIYYVSPIIKKILVTNNNKLKFVYAGIKLFVSQRSDVAWRVQSESVALLKAHISDKRQFKGNLNLLKVLLQDTFPSLRFIKENKIDEEFVNSIEQVDEGCCFLEIKREGDNKETLFLPLWKGKSNLNLMVNKHEGFELLYRLFEIETTKEEAMQIKAPPILKTRPPIDGEAKSETETPVETDATTEASAEPKTTE